MLEAFRHFIPADRLSVVVEWTGGRRPYSNSSTPPHSGKQFWMRVVNIELVEACAKQNRNWLSTDCQINLERTMVICFLSIQSRTWSHYWRGEPLNACLGVKRAIELLDSLRAWRLSNPSPHNRWNLASDWRSERTPKNEWMRRL